MISFANCRIAVLRSAWLRGFGVLLLFALIVTGLPRLQIHALHSAEHAHEHTHTHAHAQVPVLADHTDPIPTPEEHPESVVLHGHFCASAFAIPTSAELALLNAITPAAWSISMRAAQPANPSAPPPDRPPIV